MVAKFEKMLWKIGGKIEKYNGIYVAKLKKLMENRWQNKKLEKSEGKINVEIEKLEKYNGKQVAKLENWKKV